MTDDSSIDSDDLIKAVNKGAKEIKKGFLSGLGKLKKNLDEAIAESNIQENIHQGDTEKIADSGKKLSKALMKGVAEGLPDVVAGLTEGGTAIIDAMNKAKKKHDESLDDEDLDQYR